MKQLVLVLLIFSISCSSAQIIKSANDDIARVEKERMKTISGIIKDSQLSDNEKKLLINELKSKDEIIESLNKTIEAYRIDTNKAVEKSDNAIAKAESKIDKASDKMQDCQKEAGFGQAFKWIIYVAIGAGLIYLVYLILTKFNLLNFLKGSK